MKAFLDCKSPQPMERLLGQATAAKLPEIVDSNDHV